MAPHSSALAGKCHGQSSQLGAKSQTRLSDFTFTFHFHALEKEMAAHSSVLTWRIPRTVDPGGLPSVGLQNWTWLKRQQQQQWFGQMSEVVFVCVCMHVYVCVYVCMKHKCAWQADSQMSRNCLTSDVYQVNIFSLKWEDNGVIHCKRKYMTKRLVSYDEFKIHVGYLNRNFCWADVYKYVCAC